ncbi:unnamed protein product, partial [Prunus brigantina]
LNEWLRKIWDFVKQVCIRSLWICNCLQLSWTGILEL